jgi:HlyD family secretion protein
MSVTSTVYVPTASTARRWVGWWVVPVAVLIAVGVAALALKPWRNTAGTVVSGQFYRVQPMDLEIKIVKDGELQAVEFTDIKCDVEGRTTIIYLVKEGVTVRKGDVLVKLDPTFLEQRKEDVDQNLLRAATALQISRESLEMQKSQNNANLEAATVALQLARLEMEQYVKGTYPQQEANAKTALTMAETNLNNRREELEQTRSLFAKGFVMAAEVKKAALDVTVAENDVQKARTALKVLQEYTHTMDMARLRNAVMQAEARLTRVQKENISALVQREADVREKEKWLATLEQRAAKLQEQLDLCTIRAPRGGLVLYASSVDRSMREPIQEGIEVRQNQWLLRLPDVDQMKAMVKIQESQKARVDNRDDLRAVVRILGVDQPVGARLTRVAVLPDGAQRWWNPDLKEYPIELTLDQTPPGLKPGTRVDVELLVDRYEQVLAVPLASIYTVGSESYVFVRNGQGVRERRVQLGNNNESYVQITQGLQAGEEVLLLQPGQGRLLLERAGVGADPLRSSPPAAEPLARRTADQHASASR